MKKAICVGVFDSKLICQASPYPGDNVFAKGLEGNGYSVTRFDYRASAQPNEELINISEQIKPDLFYFGKCETIRPETIGLLRKKNKNSVYIKFAADVRDNPTNHDLAHCSEVDWFFGTFGGDYLKQHLLPNMIGVGSIFTFTDSHFYTAVEIPEQYQSDVLWTGRRGFGDNPLRNEIIDSFSDILSKQAAEAKSEKHINIKMFGHDSTTWLGSPEYNYYINGTKIGIGSNSFNRTKYSSDRLGNYMACGTFYLTQYIEGIEEVFTRGEHLDWFFTVEEMHEKIKYYLSHPVERDVIAEKGRQRVLEYFDSRRLLRSLLQIIKHKKKQHPWEDVFIN